MSRAYLIGAVAAALLPIAVSAQPAPDAQPDRRAAYQQMRAACATDMQQGCADAGDDRKARRQCMNANQSRFSPPCQAAIAQMRQSRRGDAAPGNTTADPQR